MSEAATSDKPEPHPFEKFQEFAAKIIAVPKAEADAEEKRWQEERSKTRKQREDRIE